MSKVVSMVLAAHRLAEHGQHAEAERVYRQALAAAPANPSAARGLARLLLDRGDPGAAAEVMGPAAAARPLDAEVQGLYGECLVRCGNVDAGASRLESASSLDPGSAGLRLALAKARSAQGRHGEAEMLLNTLARERPNDPAVHSALGHARVGMGRRRDAVPAFARALSQSPTPLAHSELGYALYITDDLDGAMREFEAAIAGDGTLAAAIGGKAMILADRGDRAGAHRLAAEALGSGLHDAALVTTLARTARSPEERAAACGALERSLLRPGAGRSERSSHLLALGAIRESEGEYDRAFECFREANGLVAAAFDAPAVERATRETIEVFSRETLAAVPRASRADRLPVFIVGMPRSGTTLVEQVLASHPLVHGAGELTDLGALAHRAPGLIGTGAGFPGYFRGLTVDQVDRLAAMHLEMLRSLAPGAERVVDKMPLNYAYLGLIDALFPGATVIHCVRHPLDTCVSCYTTGMNLAHAYRTRFKDLAAVYRAYRRVMDHWKAVVRVPILDVVYEDMVEDPEGVSRRIVEFAGLSWDPACLDFHAHRRIVRTASSDQVKRPIYSSSVGRWKHYERHLGELIDALGELAEPGRA